MLFNSTWGNGSDTLNTAMRAAINDSTAKFTQSVTITLKDGVTTYTFTDAELYQGGLSFENAICGANQFPIGTMVTGKCTVKIFDTVRAYPSVDFYGARIEPYITVTFNYNGSARVATFAKGKYTCNSQRWNNGVFTVEGLDDIDKLNVAFDPSWLGASDYGYNIVYAILTHCGISLAPGTLVQNIGPSDTFTIPQDVTMTCRDVIAELNTDGGYIRMDSKGYYDYSSFIGYAPTISGGHTDLVTSQYSFSYTDLIEPRVFKYLNADGTVRIREVSPSAGANPYEISFVLGPFMSQLSDVDLETYATAIMTFQIAALSYYLADVSAVENPLVEAGDGIYITDVLTSTQKLIIASNVRYTFGQATQIHSYGQPLRENLATGYTQGEKSAQMANNALTEAKAYTDAQLANVTVDRITSNNSTYTFRMQNDGNAVLYNGSTAEWNSNADTTWKARQDEDPQRLYTTDTASTSVPSGTSSWTNVRTFTVPYTGWYLCCLNQYINLSPSSGHFAMRITDGNSYNHNAYLSWRASAGGGTLSLCFIGYFVAGTNYHISAINTTNTNWTINRTLGDAELDIQYLHRDT